MPTQRIDLYGELLYPQVFGVNRDKTGPNGAWESKGGATKVTLIMDEENLQKFKDSGSRLGIKKSEDGRPMVQFRRFWIHESIPELGGAPVVARADGSDWDIDEDGLIGNGSKGIVRISVYDTATGPGTRLDGVQVIEHVPYETEYEPPKMFEDRTSLEAGKKQAQKAKAAKKPEVKSDLDDEIPF